MLTDNEIIKALECCTDTLSCPVDCPLYEQPMDCFLKLNKPILDLINRQKAEIKRLTSGKCVYLSDDETTEYCVEGPCPKYKTEEQIKAEAIKEFAERLKEHKIDVDVSFGYGKEVYTEAVAVIEIDNLVKEMVGAESG